MQRWLILDRLSRFSPLAFVAVLAAGLSCLPAHADSELAADEIEAKILKIDPSTGEPLFELQPIWLSPTSSVHEDLLKESFNLSQIHNRAWDEKAKIKSDETSYVQGVYWNDSPERGLCLWCSFPDNNFRAKAWLTRFRAAQAAVAKGAVFTHGSPLLERSQYGDLAFFHGMATKDGQPAAETRRHMMIWAEFAYKVATGKISALSKIRDVKVDSFSEVFNVQDTDVYDRDIRFLFSDPHNAEMFIDARRIAIGSLLHLIQDSYSPAHTDRANHAADEGRFCRGAIRRFLA
jgi:hypothetical protein